MSRLALALIACVLLLGACMAEVVVQNGQRVKNAAGSPSKASFVKDLTDASFEHDTQASSGSTTGDWLVEFYAPWCGHCKTLAPTWESLAEWARDEQVPVSIAKVDATVHSLTARRFGIRGYPSLRLLSQGRVYEYQGPRTLDALKKWVGERGWLAEGVKSYPMPPETTTLSLAREWAGEVVGDVRLLLERKTGGVALLVGVGALMGILVSMIVFIVCFEKKPIVHTVSESAVARAAARGQANAASASSAANPPDDAMKKAQ